MSLRHQLPEEQILLLLGDGNNSEISDLESESGDEIPQSEFNTLFENFSNDDTGNLDEFEALFEIASEEQATDTAVQELLELTENESNIPSEQEQIRSTSVHVQPARGLQLHDTVVLPAVSKNDIKWSATAFSRPFLKIKKLMNGLYHRIYLSHQITLLYTFWKLILKIWHYIQIFMLNKKV